MAPAKAKGVFYCDLLLNEKDVSTSLNSQRWSPVQLQFNINETLVDQPITSIRISSLYMQSNITTEMFALLAKQKFAS